MSEADLAEVWARSLDELAEMHIEPAQRAWLQLTRPLGLVENTALIATPNEFVKEQLETRLRSLITNALSRELGRSIQLAVTVDPAVISAIPLTAGHEHPAPAPQAGPGLAMNRMTDMDHDRGPARRGQPDLAADGLGPMSGLGIGGRGDGSSHRPAPAVGHSRADRAGPRCASTGPGAAEPQVHL